MAQKEKPAKLVSISPSFDEDTSKNGIAKHLFWKLGHIAPLSIMKRTNRMATGTIG